MTDTANQPALDLGGGAAPLYHFDLAQGTPEWLAARTGRVTSSGAENILPLRDLYPPEKGAGRDNEKGRMDYALRLAIERVTGAPVDDTSFSSVAMERGTALEPAARAEYTMRHFGEDVRECGFVQDQERLIGDSPDALVFSGGEYPVGGGEFKCPGPVTHWEYREAGVVPREYMRQMLHHLHANPTADWWDFASYHPAFPGELSWFEVRLTREAAQPMLDIYAAALARFLALVDTVEARVRAGA